MVAVSVARREHEARVKLSTEMLNRDLKAAERVAEEAFVSARARYEEVAKAQCQLLHDAKAECANTRASTLAAAREAYEAEIATLEAHSVRQEGPA
jgi:predicted lipoprotein